ncbi:hypothetical protein ACFL1R_08290 [Candidatus Latescibacterota bacterium]
MNWFSEELLGYEYQTLKNISSVSENVELSRRQDTVSFSHHAEVASLTPAEQSHWLNKAEKEQLSVRELREQIRESKKSETPELSSGRYCINRDCHVDIQSVP